MLLVIGILLLFISRGTPNSDAQEIGEGEYSFRSANPGVLFYLGISAILLQFVCIVLDCF